MIEKKVYDLNIAVYKHVETDKDQAIFISGFPNTYDVANFTQGKINDDMRKFFNDLSVVIGVHIAISDMSEDAKE